MGRDDRDDGPDEERREFLKKCGKFAAVTPPAVTFLLSTSMSSKAIAASAGSGGGGGGGSGAAFLLGAPLIPGVAALEKHPHAAVLPASAPPPAAPPPAAPEVPPAPPPPLPTPERG